MVMMMMKGIEVLPPSNQLNPTTLKQSKNITSTTSSSFHFNPNPNKNQHPMPSFSITTNNNPQTQSPLVVVGSANADIYVEIDRLPKEGETISANSGQTLAGGKGANQAVCGGKLAYPTYFLGQIGEDAHGKLVTDALKGCGVNLECLNVVTSVPTGHAVVMLQSDGQNSIIIVGGANMSCWPDTLSDRDLDVVRASARVKEEK